MSSGQLDCLRLVAENYSSKEIAGELGISSHTVDQRIRQSLHILGVERRSQAACISPDSKASRGC
ncbi:MAG: helix-turn-helix transcriptional regulator [Sphingomicrobium sp.]